jgi:hypothetical protein
VRLLEAICAVPDDSRGERRVEDRHLAAERREVRHSFAARTIRRYQLGHGPPALCDHDLATLADFIEKNGEILAGLANSGGAHGRIVLHVAHGVNAPSQHSGMDGANFHRGDVGAGEHAQGDWRELGHRATTGS